MKLLRLLAGYTLYDHKTNDSVRRELQTECILDKIDEYRWHWFYTCKECHQTESLWNHITTDHKEEEQLEDRRSVGENSYNSGDGTDQRVQSLMFMMMILKAEQVAGIKEEERWTQNFGGETCRKILPCKAEKFICG